SRAASQISRSRRHRRPRPRLRSSQKNAGLVPHRTSRCLFNSAVQAHRRNPRRPVAEIFLLPFVAVPFLAVILVADPCCGGPLGSLKCPFRCSREGLLSWPASFAGSEL